MGRQPGPEGGAGRPAPTCEDEERVEQEHLHSPPAALTHVGNTWEEKKRR